ncbi:hypothetical protein AGDE_12633 [Angomonas deanei]|nr:hypothetical protein AGDE_12633 [Angomonas deanei]|eukprot:EPY23925.1 hypothetical protein AGDE_12633 [Angomonas deanei]
MMGDTMTEFFVVLLEELFCASVALCPAVDGALDELVAWEEKSRCPKKFHGDSVGGILLSRSSSPQSRENSLAGSSRSMPCLQAL